MLLPWLRTKKLGGSIELPPIKELRVLPSDEGFSWARENYNSVQRSIDVWSFVLSFHVCVLFDNAKWSYIGGFTEDKQDRVLAFSPKKAKVFIANELGAPVDIHNLRSLKISQLQLLVLVR
ncbi:hypothetical protein RHSIM_Rhsim02G0059300 [Rhododendron simsii]|uniref:Uncharacterized protein n=1 Tax=Rhododendron simsii TaxID=118357 RepID=A0A834HCA3_RHOSS|nr:hypothetical protein RHSIM_Rhsim02G0059300 [Rhododendron simsii]